MRPVSILLLFALTSNFTPRTDGEVGATAISSDPAQIVRALRAVRDTDEERAPYSHITEDIIAALRKSNPSLLNKINKAYGGLSLSGKKKIFDAQHEAILSNFEKGDLYDPNRPGLRAPTKYIKSAQGAARGPNKVTAGGVVYRLDEKGDLEFLLIGSSNSQKLGFSLPKGTQEADESIETSAMREIIEEAGHLVTLEHRLDEVKRGDKSFYPFVAKSRVEYGVYAENLRPRIWLSEDDARAVLKDEMLQVFEDGVRILNAKTKPDETLRQIKLF